MVKKPTLIYCAGGNPRFMKIATQYGFRSGARLPGGVSQCYLPLYFADQDWKNPDRERYMKALDKYRPVIATVLDWEEKGLLAEVIDWAEEAAQFVQKVIIIPKVIGGIPKLPRTISGKQVVLGYSVPTRYGGTSVPQWEFANWPIHLLGGSPHRQMEYWRLFVKFADVVSVDGNYFMKKATAYAEYWDNGRWYPVGPKQYDAPYEAFRRSCENVMQAWGKLGGIPCVGKSNERSRDG